MHGGQDTAAGELGDDVTNERRELDVDLVAPLTGADHALQGEEDLSAARPVDPRLRDLAVAPRDRMNERGLNRDLELEPLRERPRRIARPRARLE